MRKVRVLVVDDSAFMRRVLSDIINSEPKLDLMGTARDGLDAINKIMLQKPDVVTLDLEMPRLNGLETLKRIVKEFSLPVVMLSSHTSKGSEITMKALEAGAVDFITKPGVNLIESSPTELKISVVEKILAAATVRVELIAPQIEPAAKDSFSEPHKRFQKKGARVIIALGASTGGPKALESFFRILPGNIEAAILLSQHMPPGFTFSFAERLNMLTTMEVKEAKDGDKLLSGRALLAPGDFHLVADGDIIHLDGGPKVNYVRPSIDVMLESLVTCEQRVIVVIMTGMGRDGASGAMKLKKAKKDTIVLAQHPGTALIPSMPEALIKTGICDEQIPLEKLADKIESIVKVMV